MKRSTAWVAVAGASLILGWGNSPACTLGSQIYEEAGPSRSGAIVAAIQILTGKNWNALDQDTQHKLIMATMYAGATHVATNNGVEEIDTLLTERNLRPGRYRIYDVEDESGFIRMRLGGKEYWIEEWHSCYSTYNYDILVWNGYGGELCSESDYDPMLGNC